MYYFKVKNLINQIRTNEFGGKLSEITLRINIPKEILKEIDLKQIAKSVEEEIMLEYNLKKLYGKFKGKDIKKLLEAVEEEWGQV